MDCMEESFFAENFTTLLHHSGRPSGRICKQETYTCTLVFWKVWNGDPWRSRPKLPEDFFFNPGLGTAPKYLWLGFKADSSNLPQIFWFRQTTKSTPGRQVVHWRNKVMSFQQFDGGLVVFESCELPSNFMVLKIPVFFSVFFRSPIFPSHAPRWRVSHGGGKIRGREGEHPQLVGWVCWSHTIGRVFAARDAHPLCRTYSQHWHLGGLLFPRPSDSGGFVKNNHHDLCKRPDYRGKVVIFVGFKWKENKDLRKHCWLFWGEGSMRAAVKSRWDAEVRAIGKNGACCHFWVPFFFAQLICIKSKTANDPVPQLACFNSRILHKWWR